MQGSSRASLATARERLSSAAAATDPTVLSQDLLALSGLLAGEPQLRRAFADPSLPEQAKSALVDRVLSGKLAESSVALVRQIAGLRWSRPADLVDVLESLAVQAAFEQALAAGTLDEVEDQVFRFGRIVARESALRAALSDAGLPDQRKRDLLDGLLADKVDPIALRVITAAVLNTTRGRSLETALDEFTRLAASIRERMIAHVTVAVLPDSAQLEAIGAALARLYGHEMDLQVEVDSRVVGGVVVRVGDEVLDASVTGRLAAAQRQLAQ